MKNNKITMDELFQREKDRAVKIEDTKAEIQALKNKAKEQEEQAGELAIADDLEEYMNIKAALAKTKAAAEIRQMQLERMQTTSAVSKDDVIEAWGNYIADDYEAKFSKAAGALDRAKKDMVKAVADIVKIQNEALKLRRQAGELIGVKVDNYGISEDAALQMFPIKTLLPQWNLAVTKQPFLSYCGKSYIPEVAFYLAETGNNPGEAAAMHRIVQLRSASV